VYELLDAHYGDVFALIASVLPPLLWSAYELAKTRRIDAISIIVIASILFTVAATAMGGSARLIQIRDALVTGVVGIIFLFSLLLPRPIIFYLARATMARHTVEGAEHFETVWNKPGVPKILRLLTGIWGIGLIAQTATMCWLAYIWPIGRYLLISPIICYGIFGLLFIWSLWYLAKNGQAGKAIFQRG
jgi:intracellular septation protein A